MNRQRRAPTAAREALLAALVLTSVAAAPAREQVAGSDAYAALVVPDALVIDSRIAGAVERAALRPGDAFDANEVLLRFDCRELRALLAQAEAEVDAALAAQAASARLADLGAASEVETRSAEAALAGARATRDIRDAQVTFCDVRAPFDGSVVAIHARTHEWVERGAPLIEVVASGALEIELVLPSQWLAWLAPGQRFELDVHERGRRVVGELEVLVPRVDPVARTVQGRGRVVGDATGLMDGMSGRAYFDRSEAGSEPPP